MFFSSENNDTEQPADESVLAISEQAAKHGVLCEPRLTCGLLRFCSRLHASLAIAAFDVGDRREGFGCARGPAYERGSDESGDENSSQGRHDARFLRTCRAAGSRS
jgi:hypothetical protein